MPKPLTWDDAEDIGILLSQAHPEVDPLTVRFTDLHRFVTELQSQAQNLGEFKLEKSSSAAGAMHRAWINLKSVVTSGDDKAILSECERGEDSAVHEYQDAMQDGLTGTAREVVSRQFTEIKSAHDRVRELRDAAKS